MMRKSVRSTLKSLVSVRSLLSGKQINQNTLLRGLSSFQRPTNQSMLMKIQPCYVSPKLYAHSNKCSQELVEFLEDEITTEKGMQKSQTIPSKVQDFDVKLDGSEVTLVKTIRDETVEVNLNVNHSVCSSQEPAINDEQDGKDNYGEMKSRPNFDVNIKRGDTTLTFTCSYLTDMPPESEDGFSDVFAIDEVTLYTGEWKETNYVVSGEVLDGALYDLLMNYLEEKGISNEFVDQMSELCTLYEHSTYINLLRELRKFASN